jgi:hypothetical protein
MTTLTEWRNTMKKPNFDFAPLKRQIEEQPLIAAGIGIAALNGVAKLMQANNDRKNSKTWKREVIRRERQPKR